MFRGVVQHTTVSAFAIIASIFLALMIAIPTNAHANDNSDEVIMPIEMYETVVNTFWNYYCYADICNQYMFDCTYKNIWFHSGYEVSSINQVQSNENYGMCIHKGRAVQYQYTYSVY